MKELKHLMYFERLLDDAHNELVRQAEAEGDLAIGYTCFHAPEVLLIWAAASRCVCARRTPRPWSWPPTTWPTTAA